jgi:NAD(P)-dependent dehydrogenase (short-subunit alcohol dehydrogenase family)
MMSMTTIEFGSLEGRVALVTGGASGMGKSSCELFARHGAHVVVIDRDGPAAESLVESITADGGKAEAVILDLTDVDGIQSTVTGIGDRHGRIDVLFNHAGSVCAPGMAVTPDDWEIASAVNLRAPIFMTQAALPYLEQPETASVIFTASIAGLVASPNSPLYSALKGGVVQYAKSIAFALGPRGIRANVICPGTTDTPMLPTFFSPDKAEAEAGMAKFLEKVPLRRIGQPHEVANLALFLASDASAYVNGVAIPVDGGYVAG